MFEYLPCCQYQGEQWAEEWKQQRQQQKLKEEAMSQLNAGPGI